MSTDEDTAATLAIDPPEAPEVTAAPPDPQPEVEPEADEDEGPDAPPPVPQAVVRGLLSSVGLGLHFTLGHDDVPDHWQFTAGELDALTPPLTRIINRRPALRRAAHAGDAMTIATTLAGYTGRNVIDARRAADARHDEPQEEPDARDQPRQARPAPAGGPTYAAS